MPMYSSSQLIASVEGDFSMRDSSQTIIIDFANDYDAAFLWQQLRLPDFHSKYRLSLHFEHLTGNDLLPIIGVYLNLDEHSPREQNFIGSLALYRLSESSAAIGSPGQHRVIDAGPAFKKASEQAGLSEKKFRLTLISHKEFPAGARLRIGCIMLYLSQL